MLIEALVHLPPPITFTTCYAPTLKIGPITAAAGCSRIRGFEWGICRSKHPPVSSSKVFFWSSSPGRPTSLPFCAAPTYGIYYAFYTMSQFQLFPPPPSEGKGSKNPFRRGIKKPPVKDEPGSPIPLQEVKDTSKTESVLLQITEDTHQFPPPPPAPGRSKSPPSAVASYRSISPLSTNSQSRQANRSNQFAGPLRGSSSNSSVHTANSAVSPQSSHSSVSPVPMRSMFPQFDPKVPLNRQEYHPPMSNNALAAKSSRRPHLTLSPTSEIDHALGPKTVPASVLNFPTDVLEPEEIRNSSPQELEMLWEVANGQRPQNIFGTFNLRMTK